MGVLGAVFGFIVFPGVVLLSILLVRRRRKTYDSVQLATLLVPKRGSTPDSAIRISTEDELDELLKRFQCSCGQRPYKPESPPVRERFRYDGELLTGMRLHCQSCGQDGDLYVNLTANRSELVELGLNSVESTRQ
jgi:hypothetical protein